MYTAEDMERMKAEARRIGYREAIAELGASIILVALAVGILIAILV